MLVPATVIKLVQEDEEERTGNPLSFDDAFRVAQHMCDIGAVLLTGDFKDDSTLNRDFIANMLDKLNGSDTERR